MKFHRREGQFIVRLDPGEELMSCLAQFAHQCNVNAGHFTGLGTAKDVELGFFETARKDYMRRLILEDLEIVNLTGTIAMLDSAPYIHCHAIFSRRDLSAIAGHLFRATVTATAEVMVSVIAGRIDRRFDPEVGMNLMAL